MGERRTVGNTAGMTSDDVVRRVTEISSLPSIAARVIEVVRDPNAGAADLKRVVEGDPSLGARVIRMVNSAAYGLRGQIGNLQQAISYLGFNQVRNLAMTASVSEIFGDEVQTGTYCRKNLWRHMVACGICARMVARRCRMGNFEDAFLAGLLHDIGIIIEDQHVHDKFKQIVAGIQSGRTLCEVETEVLGFDHTRMGEALAERWKFPPVVKATIRNHHGSERFHGEGVEIVRCVEVANVVCTLKNFTSIGVKALRPPLEAFRALGLQKEDLIVLASDLDREISQSESLFEI